MMNAYHYLFPFEKVPHGSKILIYGAGDVGVEYLKQVLTSGYCQCLGFVDRSWDKLPRMIVNVYSPSSVNDLEYDYIVLALKTGMHVRSIRESLGQYGIDSSKVIYQEQKKAIDVFVYGEKNADNTKQLACEKINISIALKFGQGLGDCIVRKKCIIELINMAPGCFIDTYSPNAEIVKTVFGQNPTINRIIEDGGATYQVNKYRYDVAITLSVNAEVDWLNLESLSHKNLQFSNIMRTMQENVKRYNLPIFPVTNMNIHFQRMKYLGYNYYNYLNYTGVFDIQDQNVDIPLAPNYKEVFENMCLDQFITINYGTAVALKNNLDSTAKQWPYRRFCEFVKLFKEKYPHIKVVQLGVKDAAKVEGVDKYILGESLELVKYVLKNSMVHLDSEGGLVHLATNLGTKCVVMFGPTPEWFYGYKQNVNIVSEVCSGCYCLYDGFDVCAKGITPAPCMMGIGAEKALDGVSVILKV